LLGAVCDTEAGCRDGLTCLAKTSTRVGGEGPSAGLCVSPCTDDGDCSEHDDASCVTLFRGESGDVSYCLPGCSIGDPEKNDDKCRGRVDLVCSEAPAGSGSGYCRPACRSDLDCAPRICNPRTGLCGDSAPQGDPIGAACDPNASECAGGCIAHGGGFSECSSVCSVGTPSCGQPNASSPPFDFYCYLEPVTNSGQGDLGYCSRLCDCNDDCDRPDAVCEPKSKLESETQRRGVCSPRTFASGAERPNLPCGG
jgi:hypothetical protein